MIEAAVTSIHRAGTAGRRGVMPCASHLRGTMPAWSRISGHRGQRGTRDGSREGTSHRLEDDGVDDLEASGCQSVGEPSSQDDSSAR